MQGIQRSLIRAAVIGCVVLGSAAVAAAPPLPGDTAALVTIDGTGTMLIDGEPFFPIGLYQVPWWDMADVKAHGFNIVDEIQPLADYRDRTFLNAAKENGLWVRIPLYSGGWWNGDWEEMRESQDWSFFKDYPGDHTSPKHHPAFAMWYPEDEPRHNPPEPYYSNMRAMHDYIDMPGIDPDHPDMTCLYDAHFGEAESEERMDYFRIYSFFDVVGVDCYPLKSSPAPNPADAPLTAVARWIDDAYEAIRLEGEDATVHSVIEAFQFGSWRMPTPEQLKLMVYLSVIHGAKGIWYFCYGTSSRDGVSYGPGVGLHDFPEMWEYIGGLNRQLASLAEVFLAPPVPTTLSVETAPLASPDRYGYGPIHCLFKEYDGSYYLITANGSGERAYTTTFHLPFIEGISGIEALFEVRSSPIERTADGFTDHYDPLEVHVYKISRSEWPGLSFLDGTASFGEGGRR